MFISGINGEVLCYCKLAAAIRLSLMSAARDKVALHPQDHRDLAC